MSSKERVDRVLAAVVHIEYESDPDFNITQPLIGTGEEYYFTSQDGLRSWIRRILAAADGVEEFTDVVKPYRPERTGVRSSKKPNIEARNRYAAQKRERRNA